MIRVREAGSCLLVLGLLTGLLTVSSSTPVLATENSSWANVPPATPTPVASSVSSSRYWFEVGVQAASVGTSIGAVTGGRVTICTATNMKLTDLDAGLSYWVGLDLPNDAFIQSGFIVDQYRERPSWFWEYFPPGTASHPSSVGFIGGVGSAINGCHMFSVANSGTVWYAYMDNRKLGSVDLQVTDSGGNRPYAIAEVAGTSRLDNKLGHVEFRNLQFRGKDGVWHEAAAGLKIIGYGAGSAYVGWADYPAYGVQGYVGENNHWLAGDGLNWDYSYLWPWHHVTVRTAQGTIIQSGMYVFGYSFTPAAPEVQQLSSVERLKLKGWSLNGNLIDPGIPVTVSADIDLRPVYQKEFLIQTETAAGTAIMLNGQPASSPVWYAEGETVTLTVQPTTIPWNGLLGQLGFETRFQGWVGDITGPSPTLTFTVQKPTTIHTTWGTNLKPTTANITLTLTLGSLATLTAYAIRHRKKDSQLS